MSAHNDNIERDAAAIGIWENEGGALRPDAMDHQFGGRIEADCSWTVFTGAPAHTNDQTMTGLSRSGEMSGMLFVNLQRRVEPIALPLSSRKTPDPAVCQS